MSRPNFIELCARLTAEDEKAFEALWRYLGLSVDWAMTYATIDTPRAARVAGRRSCGCCHKGHAYQLEAPTLWDVDFRTAVAQAELEDREQPGAYHRIEFARGPTARRQQIAIETTRPELIPACVALVAHPDDERYKPLFGTEVVTPLFGVRVPVRPHELADPEKGSGIAMICTFGDVTDVIWWRALSLPVRAIIAAERRAASRSPWGSDGLGIGRRRRARSRPTTSSPTCRPRRRARRSSSCCKESGDLVGEPRPITHAVKFYEKGDRPLEIVTSRQWFIKTMDVPRARCSQRARELQWHPGLHAGAARELDQRPERRLVRQPPALLRRAVSGLVSGAAPTARRDYAHPLAPAEVALPIDPSTDVPDGYRADQRDQPGGFTGDPDIMDTWATSSLSPQIAGRWLEDPDLFARVFPMDVRPQAHDIIRTWLFSTVLRSDLEFGTLPWAQRRDLGLGPRSRPQEDVEVEGQRRHADGPARGARRRRRALLGGERAARHRHRLRHRPDEGRPPAGDQAAERVEVRARRSPEPRGDA